MTAIRCRISRPTSTEPTYTRCSTLVLWNSCLLLESRRSENGFFARDSAGIYRNSEQTQGCKVGSCDSSGSGKGRSQKQHEDAHDTVWIVVNGRLLRCAPEHLRHLSERESLSIDRDKVDREKARTFTDIVQDFRLSKGTHDDLRSQHDPPDGSEPRHFSGKIFVRTPTEMPGTSSSGVRTETRPVVEPTVVPSGTNLDPMSATHDSSEPTPVPGTDETQDRESPDMETDDHDTMTAVPEPSPVSQSVPPSQNLW